jgi:hypothetical protein
MNRLHPHPVRAVSTSTTLRQTPVRMNRHLQHDVYILVSGMIKNFSQIGRGGNREAASSALTGVVVTLYQNRRV